MASGSQGEWQWVCRPCKLVFSSSSSDSLSEHKREMMEAGESKHIYCNHCGQEFETTRAEMIHIRQLHAQDQKLVCSACGAGPFARLSHFMMHIEQGQCPKLSLSDLDERRLQRSMLSKTREQLGGEPSRYSFFHCLASPSQRLVASPDSWFDTKTLGDEKSSRRKNAWLPGKESRVSEKGVGCEGINDWSVKSDARTQPHGADGNTGQPDGDNIDPWATDVNNSWPRAEIATAPPATDRMMGWRRIQRDADKAERQACHASGVPHTLAQGYMEEPRPMFSPSTLNLPDTDHPDHPSFRATRYWNRFSEAFSCPKAMCRKAFSTERALVAHLRSSIHASRKYKCPYCYRIFNSVAGMAAHAEQSSARCRIRDSDDYHAFVDQLTGGIIEVDDERNSDGSIKYRMVADWTA